MNALAVIDSPMIANVDAEMGVIGAALYEPKTIDRVADLLAVHHFADPFLGRVYGTIVREHSLGRSLSTQTVRAFIEQDPSFALIGGMRWLAGIAEPTLVIGALDNARLVVESYRRRSLIEGLRETIIAAADYDRPVDELVSAADEAISLARDSDGGSSEFSGAQCLQLVVDGFDAPINGVQCGIIEPIDRLLGPLRPKNLIIGAGRPGMGKSATAISYALGAAAKGHGTLFVSMEMSAEEIGERMAADLCLEHRIAHELIRDHKLSHDQKRQVCRAMDRVSKMPLQVIDRAGITISQLRIMVRRWQRRFAARGQKLELVIVDYLQLMNGPGKDRYERVSNISQGLKELAKELEIAVFALAQLSRKVEERADKRPIMADLRESGQIEQDADAILFFLRDEYYLRLNEPPENDPKRASWEDALQKCVGGIEFICAKRRAGSTGSLIGQFLYHYQAVRG